MNNQTFEEFYLKYRKISRGYAYGVLHDWNAADDVSQDVLYKMYTKRKHLNIDNEKMMYSFQYGFYKFIITIHDSYYILVKL